MRPSTSLGPVQPLGRAHHDHRPARPAGIAVGPRMVLDRLDLGDDRIEGRCHQLVHDRRVVALDEIRLVAVAHEQLLELVVADPRQHGRVGDLVAVQVQDRQHGAVAHRVEELVGMPGGGERAGLGLAVAHHAGHQQVRIVERGAIGVGDRVAELAALVDRARGLGRDMAGNAARKRELLEQALACPRRPPRCSDRPRCRCPRDRCWRPGRGRRGRGRRHRSR